MVPDGTNFDVYIGAETSGEGRAVQINTATSYTVGSVFFQGATALTYSILLSSSGSLTIANDLSIDAATALTPTFTDSSTGTGRFVIGTTSGTTTNTWTNNSSQLFTLAASAVVEDTASGNRTWVIGGSGNWVFNALTSAGAPLSISSNLSGGKELILSKQGSGTLTLNSSNTFGGEVDVTGGSLIVGSDSALGATSNALSVTGGTVGITTFSATVGALTVDGGSITGSTGSLNVSSITAKSGTVSAVLTGTGALTKTTNGILTFSKANTYSGGNTISAGTLVLSGSGTVGSGKVAMGGGTLDITGISAGTYTLGTAQALSGNGTINASGKTLVASGVVDPNSTSGGLVINGGTLSLVSTTSYSFNLSTPSSSDAVNFLGGATLDIGSGLMGFSDFTFVADSGFGNGTYILFSGASSLLGSLDGSDLTGTINGLSATLGTSGNNITLSVVPEPSGAILLTVGLLALVVVRRRTRAVS